MLEVLAMISMLVDHIGKIFFPAVCFYEIVGRLALPLYTYGIVQGFIHTRNVKKYFLRLLCLAIVSQFFFARLFQSSQLNIIFTYLLILILLSIFKQYRIKFSFKLLLVLLAGILMTLLHLEAGVYTLFLALIYYQKKNILFYHLLLNLITLFTFHNKTAFIQMFSVFGTLLIYILPAYRLSGLARSLYRVFYPAHLFVLWVIK